MTTVGKFLVIIIMVFSLLFLAFSTVVFTTEKNWKNEADNLKKKIDDLSGKVKQAQNELTTEKSNLKKSQDDITKQKGTFDARFAQQESDLKARQNELEQQRANLAKALQTEEAALAEAEQRKKETDNLRTILSDVQKQANDYGLRQTQLNDEIRVLRRQLETATTNNKDLRERVTLLSGALQRAGLSSDVEQLRGLKGPAPQVEGYVKRVDARNKRVEISIGSDDGLVVGHELDVWRTKPTPEYLGKIRIESVEPDQAVGLVLGKTVLGKKIEEGDNVAPTIRPR
jgi:hypothetical protein